MNLIVKLYRDSLAVFLLLLLLIVLHDLLDINGPVECDYLRVSISILCTAFSYFSLKNIKLNNKWFFVLSFVFTIIADVLLIFYSWIGIYPFIYAQLFRFFYFSYMNKKTSITTFLLITLMILITILIPIGKDIFAGFIYATLLIANTIISFIYKPENKNIFIIRITGMLLFIGCDISVMLRYLISSDIKIFLPLMWIFYIPSQYILCSEAIVNNYSLNSKINNMTN